MSSPIKPKILQQMRRDLEDNQARRKGLFDSALDCIICTDENARITDFNISAERTFRMTRAKVLGQDLIDVIFPAALRERHRRDFFVPIASSDVEVLGSRLETIARRSDASEFPAELTVTRVVTRNTSTFIVYVRDITARDRAEKAIVWLASIVESSQDAIIGKDVDGKITSWNKGAELMYGYTAHEAIGKNIAILFPDGCIDELPTILKGVKQGKYTRNFETIRKAKNGKLLTVSLTVSPVVDSSGYVVGASAIARDITSQKNAEEALRKANETSVYASPIPIIGANTSGRVTLWNPAAAEVFGWKEAEVIGKKNPIIPPEEDAAATSLHKRLLAGQTLTGVEVRRRKRDGTGVIINMSATPLWDENHRVRGMIAFLTDITAHKRAEEALRAAEEKYRGIYENALEGIYQTTPDGRYVSGNPALARMLGFESPAELIQGRQDIANEEYVVPELHQEFVRLMEEQGVVTNFEYQAYRKDGKTIWVSENAHAVRDADGKILYFEGSVQDITQHRELEQQLRQMQKIEAIGRLAGGVAHDFNNILMATASYAELLYRKVPDGDPRRWYVDEIVKATNRGAALTQGLLAFSHKQVFAPKLVDLNALISQQIEMLKRLISENIELCFLPGENLGTVRADPAQLEQVTMNLVINARDAMPNGGTLTIRTGRESSRLVPAGAENSAASYVVLTVADNGCGMDADTQSHIFEPFFTTKEQGKGTGLGLSTVFGIVKQSGGRISVQSEVGQGTTFSIHLPCVEEGIQTEEPAPSSVAVAGTETILIVEDEEAVRKSAAEFLTENGYKVLQAAEGSEALKIAEQYSHPIHLLLTDVIMPHMSGRELSERIAPIHPETKVLFMSGYSNNLLSERQILDSKYVLLQKPFLLTALGRCIREILDNDQSHAAFA